MSAESSSGASRRPRVYIVLLNWNQWADTLRCLETVLRLATPRIKVIVCDNDSGDGSVERILGWAAGDEPVPDDGSPLAALRCPPVAKPVAAALLDRAAAEAGAIGADARLLVVRTGGNLGFAGGCNVGLRLALNLGADFVWLLNNDTLVPPGALDALLAVATADPALGIVGSTVLDYARPDRVQALGGCTFNRWLARPRHIGEGLPVSALDGISAKPDYVLGASMLVSRPFLEQVGLMDERFFLYFEEVDWAFRARNRFALAHAPDSIVYHRMGGSSGHAAARSYGNAAERLMFRNRLLFARKHMPWALPTVYAGLALAFAKSVLTGRWGRVRMFSRPGFWALPPRDGR